MVLLALCLSTPAQAARNEEVIRYPSLLMFGEVTQSVGISYSLSQHSGAGSSSSASSLSERYSLTTVAAILDPHLVTIQILGGVSYSQQFDQTSSKLLDGEYNISASAFDMSYHPISLGSSRTTTIVSNGYTPSYSLTTNNNQISATLLNVMVPAQVFYAHSTSDTSGLQQNSSSVSDSVGISMHHDYKDISSTNASLLKSGTQAGDTNSNMYSLSLSNYLALDQKHSYRLSSSLDIVDSKSTDVPERNIGVTEELTCAFGAALSGALSDRYSYNSTVGFDSQAQTLQTNAMSASLSHRLFNSLVSSVTGTLSTGSLSGGSTTNYGGTGRLTYTKVLPAQSNMTLTMQGSRNIASQDLAITQLSARDEQHLLVNQGDRITPDLSGKLTDVIRVQSLNRTPQITYVEGVDYRVDFLLGQIEILAGAGVVPNSDIVISYKVEVNPSIKYQTDSFGSSAFLSLFGGRYSLSGNFSSQSQTRLEGQATNQALVSSTSVTLRGDANFDPTLVGMEYVRAQSTQENSSHIGAYLSHTKRTGNDAAIAYTVRDTYFMIDPAGDGASGSSQNAFSVSGSYNRRFFGWINFTTTMAANDNRGTGGSTDFVTFRGVLSGGFNQLQASLSGQALFRIAGGATTEDSNLTFTISRYF